MTEEQWKSHVEYEALKGDIQQAWVGITSEIATMVKDFIDGYPEQASKEEQRRARHELLWAIFNTLPRLYADLWASFAFILAELRKGFPLTEEEKETALLDMLMLGRAAMKHGAYKED